MHLPTPPGDIAAAAERVAAGRERILAEIRKVIVGQDTVIDEVLMALSNSHLRYRLTKAAVWYQSPTVRLDCTF
jgi:hypothetical protein